jgi:hypothetical protein
MRSQNTTQNVCANNSKQDRMPYFYEMIVLTKAHTRARSYAPYKIWEIIQPTRHYCIFCEIDVLTKAHTPARSYVQTRSAKVIRHTRHFCILWPKGDMKSLLECLQVRFVCMLAGMYVCVCVFMCIYDQLVCICVSIWTRRAC